MRRSDICLYLAPADRAELQALLTNRNTSRKLFRRADIVLATADGQGTFEIMRRTGMSKPTVWRRQERYLDEGVPGLKRDKTRPSRVPPLPREVRLKVIAKTVQEAPPNATHWSRATMAEAVGISPSSVGRIWADAGLKPHIVKGFKVSNDPMFEEKVTDIVGLYLDPPDRAVVLCVDEKSQIWASAALRQIWLFIIAITIHNFPEGIAVGVGFGAHGLSSGMPLAIGIGLQNLPEGLAMAVALIGEGYGRLRACSIGALTGLVEPVGGLLGAAMISFSEPFLPWLLSFAAGAMIYVISHEIIPETDRSGHQNKATLGLAFGLVVMLFLDVWLG